MVKKGQEEVSRADSPRQGEPRDPDAPKIKHRGGSASGSRARPRPEGAGSQKGHGSGHEGGRGGQQGA